MKHFRNAMLVAVLGLLCGAAMTACTQPAGASVTPTTSASADIAYAYEAVAAVRATADTALKAGQITPAQAQEALDGTDKARALVDIAQRAHSAGDAIGMATALAQANALVAEFKR